MKRTKKFASLLLAVVMVFTLCSTALADGLSNDGSAHQGVATTKSENLTVKKTFIIHNEATTGASGLTVAYPAINFNYEVAPATAAEVEGAYVIDASGNRGSVRVGVVNGLQIGNDTTHNPTGNVSVANGQVKLNANGQEAVQGDLNLWIDVEQFPSPGIYRYKISDVTDPAVLTAAGISRTAQYDATFYLDVYIKNQNDPTLANQYYYKSGVDPSDPSAADKNNWTTDKTEAATPPVPVTVNGKPQYENELHENLLQVGGYVLTSEPNTSGIDGYDDDPNVDNDTNDNTLKDSGLDDVDLIDGGKIQNTDSTKGENDSADPTTTTEAPKVYETTDGDTTTDPDGTNTKTDDDSNPVKATDGDGNTLYEHNTSKLNPDPTKALDAAALAKCDVFYTYNVTLSKVVTGTMGDTTNEFTFAATVQNKANGHNLAFSIADENVMPASVNSATFVSDVSTNEVGLNADETVTLYGLSVHAKVNYKETNNTQSDYTVSAKNGADSDITFTEATASETSIKRGYNETATAYAAPIAIWATTVAHDSSNAFRVTKADDIYTTDAGDKVAAASATTYTNNLDMVSPTGIALRYAPYLFMLAAAAMFVVLSRKERDAENA